MNLKHCAPMKRTPPAVRCALSTALLSFLFLFDRKSATADPRTNSWFTVYSSRYARIYTNDVMKLAGTPIETWSNGSQSQALPAYAGVQAVYSSSNWVYLETSGLAQHIMGPWQNGAFP